MGHFLSWAAVVIAIYLVTFEGVLTGTHNKHESKADVTEQQPIDSIHSGDLKKPNADSNNTRTKDFILQPQSTVSGHKRALPAAALAILKNPKVQEAAIEKGVEVVGKLVDKGFENIERAQNKAAEFLKKEIKLDIMPEKSWIKDNLFVPSAYHIDATVEDGSRSPKEQGGTAFVYPAGMGQVLMNGCWGKDYQKGDPCYNAKETSPICRDMIDGAAFIGVGFDGSGTYSPESRKMSIVQRNCANKGSYDSLDVPDTMNVHGIYDTTASMLTFESRTHYQQYLQQEAGMSGSIFGFSAGVKKAWGGSMQRDTQQYMAVLDVDVDRYEIFMDEVKPSDLSLSFLREFMDLPVSYFQPGAQIKYQNFIQRWGTHYVKSARFGGQLEIRKTMLASRAQSKSSFAEKMEVEYRGLFASAGAKSSTEGGSESGEENKFTSTSVRAQGGSQEIATVLSDVYSPTFKGDFKAWLKSIPAYPKAYRFLLGTIADLVNFRANDLFAGEPVDWGCEGNSNDLVEETTGGVTKRYYTSVDVNGTVTRHYCQFQDREELDAALIRRRTSLKRAIEYYMDEGPISVSDMVIPECKSKDQNTDSQNDFLANAQVPTWKEITQQGTTVKVTFDMENDLARGSDGLVKIQRNMTREVSFTRGRWFTADRDGKFHMYSGYRNGKSAELKKHKLSIFGLVLSYNSKYGSLEMSDDDFNASKEIYPTLSQELVGFPLARVSLERPNAVSSIKRSSQPPAVIPCNVKWSNALRFDPTTTGGRCLHFTASSAGDIFVVFATIPSQRQTWYYVQIGNDKVVIYKGGVEVTKTTTSEAISIGDTLLYQSYFVCLYENPQSTLIEYGKTIDTKKSGDVYLVHLDTTDPLKVRFYAFGNTDASVKIWDAHVTPRDRTDAECKGASYNLDLDTNLCVPKCHEYCDPLGGCRNPGADILDPSDCFACRTAKSRLQNTCLKKCPDDTIPTEDKICKETFDAKTVKTGNRWGENTVNVQNIPRLNRLTLCLWTKFPQTEEDGSNNMVYYLDTTGTRGFGVTIYIQEDGTHNGLFFIRADPEHLQVSFNAKFLADHQWHQICVTWNGVTGQSLVYVDGVRDADVNRFGSHPGGILIFTLPGGGNLALLQYVDQLYYVSEVNLWSRVLYADEIVEASKSCVGSTGNVKNWFDFFPGFSSAKSTVESPSQCRSPNQSSGPEDEVPVNAASSPVESAGKKKYILKFKKHGFTKKNTSLKA